MPGFYSSINATNAVKVLRREMRDLFELEQANPSVNAPNETNAGKAPLSETTPELKSVELILELKLVEQLLPEQIKDLKLHLDRTMKWIYT